jgi:hypothetical protein
MVGSQLPKGGSRIDVGDRFRDALENFRLSAVVGRTVHHVDPQQFSMPRKTASKGRSPDQGASGGMGNGRGFCLSTLPRGPGVPGRDVAATPGRAHCPLVRLVSRIVYRMAQNLHSDSGKVQKSACVCNVGKVQVRPGGDLQSSQAATSRTRNTIASRPAAARAISRKAAARAGGREPCRSWMAHISDASQRTGPIFTAVQTERRGNRQSA